MRGRLPLLGRNLVLSLGLLGALGVAPAPGAELGEIENSSVPAGESILKRAFDTRYDCDLSAEIELRMQSRAGSERRRVVRAIVKRIEGRSHSIGRLISPPYLRGMTIMSIENRGRADDSFVYLPSLLKVRRVTTAQRADSFLGSDLTYEDLERHRLEDYEVDSVRSETVGGEQGFRIRAKPTHRGTYESVEFDIAAKDYAILEIRYLRLNHALPVRIIQAPRESMTTVDGHVLPTHLIVQNRVRGSTTEVFIRDLEVNPEIDERDFSLGALERAAVGPAAAF